MKLQLLGATLLASACAAAAANGVAPVHFSGKIVSAANARPRPAATIVPRPIEDAAHVDARRYGMGLSSLAQNLAVMAPAPQREAARPAANGRV
eukprot:gene20138-24152_t